MTLQLNQKPILGKEIIVTVKVHYGDSDLSGQGNSTETAETGIKAKQLHCSLLIPFSNPEWLSDLNSLGESTDNETGSRTIYRIGHDAANAIKFYEGKFTGELNIVQMEDILAWQVTFNIHEHLSVPERKSQREDIAPAQQQGGDVGVVVSDGSDKIPPNTQISNFTRILEHTGGSLGDLIGDDSLEVL